MISGAPRGFATSFMAHVRLARISNLPTVFTNVWAGAALAGAWTGEAATTEMAKSVLGISLAIAFFYISGMYLNDYVDHPVDMEERPERPLPMGLVSRKMVWACIWLYFGAGLLLLGLVRLAALVPGLALLGVILLYDYWHKDNRWSHWVMALARALVYVTTFVALAGSGLERLGIAATGLLLYVAGLTYIARSENRPDFARYWPVGFLVLPAGLGIWQSSGWLLLVPAIFVAWCGWSLGFVYGPRKHVGAGVVRLIAGIALLDAMVLAACGAPHLAGAAIGMFVLTRILQRYVAGG
jgi:hypothetical protein